MKKHNVILLLFLLITPCLSAQKKEISQARSYIKSGKDFDKAEQLMVNLLTDSANRGNQQIYLTYYDAVKRQYEVENEKLYLKQKCDTASIYNQTLKMLSIVEALDSIDAQPDGRRRIKPEYRKKHAAELHVLRPNLYYGGTYNYRKGNYALAFTFFDKYIDCARQPLFTGYEYLKNDSLMATAAYWTVVCGYKLGHPDTTLMHSQLALSDTAKACYILQYMAEAYLQQKNNAAYLQTLQIGFSRYPEYPYFFPRIEDYYTAKGQLEMALMTAEQALKNNPQSELFLFAKSTALLNMERYDESIVVGEQLIAQNDTLADPYFNVATAYLNQALVLEKKNEPRLYREKIRSLYMKARPYMEAYRKLAPHEKDKWAPALYRIYFNLNMGRQFEEIDRMMR